MTEVLRGTNLSEGNTANYQAAIRFDASPNLRNIVSGVLNQEGRAWLGNRAVMLASRRMTFERANDFQIFKGTKVDRLLNNSGSPLRRVDIQPGVAWETVKTPRGELNRIYFEPIPEDARQLEAVYSTYANEYGQKPYTPGIPREKMLSETLAYTVPSNFLAVDEADGVALLREAMSDGTHTSKGLYAGNPRFQDDRIR